MKVHLLVFAHPSSIGKLTAQHINYMQESALKMGHELVVIYSRNCYMKFGPKLDILNLGHHINSIKVLIVKANPSGKNLQFLSPLIKQFELMGVKVINKEVAVINAKNKIKTLQVLSKNNIAIPKSFVATGTECIDEIIKNVGSFPVIVKTVSGSHGKGVSIVETKRSLRSLIEMISKEGSPEPIIIQEYIKESKGKDVRIFVIGNKIVGAMERRATKRGEFRSNFSLGGQVKLAELSKAEKSIAINATKVCHLDFAGVDLLRTDQGPKILEVNANPGLEGITQATGIDIAGKIIQYAVKKGREKK